MGARRGLRLRGCPGCGNEKRGGLDGVSQVSAALLHCRKCDRWFANFETKPEVKEPAKAESWFVRLLKKLKAIFKRGGK